MRKKRKNYSSAEKIMLLKRHLVNKEEVSSICEEHGLHPNVFYKWQREFFENGEKAFEKRCIMWEIRQLDALSII